MFQSSIIVLHFLPSYMVLRSYIFIKNLDLHSVISWRALILSSTYSDFIFDWDGLSWDNFTVECQKNCLTSEDQQQTKWAIELRIAPDSFVDREHLEDLLRS